MENKNISKIFQNTRNKIIFVTTLVILILGTIGGLFAWQIISSRVYVEDSSVSAPVVSLIPSVGGSLQEVFVNVGDYVKMSSPIARVGNELIKAKSDGQILSLNTSIGTSFGPTQAIATMMNPDDLRVVGKVKEDKGLRDIKVGQTAIFTVDAFGSKEYQGIVDEISPISNSGDIVFNISDKRQENEFNVKIRFSADKYPELKNGMSAKLWIYK